MSKKGKPGTAYNLHGTRGDVIEKWLAAIRRDRNFARLVLDLPIRNPSPEIRATAKMMGKTLRRG